MLTLKLHKAHHKQQPPLTAEKINEMPKRGASDGFLIPSLAKSQSVKTSSKEALRSGGGAGGCPAPNNMTSSETNHSTP